MADLTGALTKLNNWIEQNKTVRVKDASESLAVLLHQARNSGLSEDVLDVCSKFLVLNCHTMVLAQMVLKCMIPKTIVPDHIVSRVLKWIFLYHKVGINAALSHGLQWIAGLLEFGLANEEPVSEYYHLFMSLLEWPILERTACWLVVRLTKPNDVTRNIVVSLLMADRKTKSRYRNIILWCYKTFKPECVPEHVVAHNVQSALKLNSHIKQYFLMAHERLIASGLTPLKHKENNMIWKIPNGIKRPRVNLIPLVEHVQFGSSLYRKQETSVLSITEWKHLAASQLQIGIPCNSMALLQNSIGHHIVASGSDTLQERFSFCLHKTLLDIIYKQLVSVPLKEQEELLNKVCELEEYMKQGIPVVSGFLASYIATWDGITFLPQLMRLVPWLTFSTFDELKYFCLDYLYHVFVSSNVMVKCSILRALIKLVHNKALDLHVIEKKLFLHSPRANNEEKILYCLIKFIEFLCKLGLNFEPDDTVLMNEILRLYEMLVDIEEKFALNVKSVLPSVVIYYVLFSRNYANTERVCNLLLKYKASVELQASLQIGLPGRVQLINNYFCDFANVLWNGQAFTDRRNGYIFRNLDITSIQEVIAKIDVDNAYFIMENIPFISVARKEGRREGREAEKHFIQLLQKYAPSIYEVIKLTVKKKRKSLSR